MRAFQIFIKIPQLISARGIMTNERKQSALSEARFKYSNIRILILTVKSIQYPHQIVIL